MSTKNTISANTDTVWLKVRVLPPEPFSEVKEGAECSKGCSKSSAAEPHPDEVDAVMARAEVQQCTFNGPGTPAGWVAYLRGVDGVPSIFRGSHVDALRALRAAVVARWDAVKEEAGRISK